MQTVKHIINLLADLVQDTDFDDYTESDWVDNYNLQLLKIITKFPDANNVTETMKLAEGTRQHLPAGGIGLIGVLANMGTDGETPGTVPNKADVGTMSVFNRNWRTADEDEEIINWMPDPADPRAFFNYPPSDGTGYVLVSFYAEHAKVVYDEEDEWESAVVAIAQKYIPRLMELMLAHYYKRDTDIPGNKERENDAEAEFYQNSQQ